MLLCFHTVFPCPILVPIMQPDHVWSTCSDIHFKFYSISCFRRCYKHQGAAKWGREKQRLCKGAHMKPTVTTLCGCPVSLISWLSHICNPSVQTLFAFPYSFIHLFFTSASLTQPENQRLPLSHYHSFETRWRSGNKRETRLNPFKSVHMSDLFYQYSEAPEIWSVIFVQPGSIDLQSVTGEKQSHEICDCH